MRRFELRLSNEAYARWREAARLEGSTLAAYVRSAVEGSIARDAAIRAESDRAWLEGQAARVEALLPTWTERRRAVSPPSPKGPC